MSEKVCTFPACGRPHVAKGVCAGHWRQQRNGKELQPIYAAKDFSDQCSFAGCGRPRLFKDGLCNSHHRQRKSGKELTPLRRRTRLAEGGHSKECADCGRVLLLSDFRAGRGAGDRRARCRPCESVAVATDKYGISTSDAKSFRSYDSCDICGTTEPRGRHDTFHIDHCHDCGEVRGVLCNECNLLLGYAGSSPDRLLSGVAYLDNSRKALA